MAITSGAGPHFAIMTVDGTDFPIEHGSVTMNGEKKTSTFSGAIPYSYPGALDLLADLGGNKTTVSVSTRGITAPLYTGELDLVVFDLVGRTIQVHGRDASAPLHENKTSEKFVNKYGHNVVSDLCGRCSIPVVTDSSPLMAGKKLQQDYVLLSDNVSFAYMIHKIAEVDNARWFMDPTGTLHYQVKSNPSGVYTLNYTPPGPGPMTADFMSLRVKLNVQAGKSQKVNVKSYHTGKKQVFADVANISGRKGTSLGNYHVPGLLQDHVTQTAQSIASERAKHEYTIEATVVGDPNCVIGMDLQINGTKYFDQSYFMDTITHEFGMSGHTTHIVARAAKAGRTDSSNEGNQELPTETEG